MLGSSELMDSLKGIGLNLYERKLWVALLAKGTATAGELSSIANVPRSRTYDVLQTLAEKGFVIVQTSKPLRYVAVTPSEALDRARKKMEEKLRAVEVKMGKLQKSKVMNELNSLFEKGLKLISIEDMTGALKGKYSVLQQTDSMFRGAKSSINILTTSAGLNDLRENHLNVLKKMKDSGVNIRIATKIGESSAEAVKALAGIADIRKINESELPISGRITVVDETQLMMGLSDAENVHSSQDMVFWTKSEHAAKHTIQPLFNLVWEKTRSSKKGK